MSYTVKYSDPNKASNTINVNDLTENNTSTSLSLVGRNFSNYGVAIASNFVHLLENFSAPISPNNAIEGQLWYDNNNNRLMLNDGTGGSTNWRPASGIHVKAGPTGPTNPLIGDLWVDTETQQLKLYNSQDWVIVGPNALSGKKTGVYVEQLADSEAGDLHYVSVEYANDDVIKITATESFIPQKKIDGFDVVLPGINISNKTYTGLTGATVTTKIYGTAQSADSLNVTTPAIATVTANNFARRDVSNILRGQQTIATDSGITIGTSNNFSLTVNQGSSIISNSADGGSIDVKITKAGASNLLMKFDGQNRRVGINHPTPNVELDVNGSAYISGTLVAKGTEEADAINKGAFQVDGGARIAKSLFLGNNANVAGQLLIGTGAITSYATTTVIAPKATDTFDIGQVGARFREVHAQRFVGDFTGAFTGSLTGTFNGQATGLTQGIRLSLDNEVTSSVETLQSGGVEVKLTSAINQKAITNRDEVEDNRTDDMMLIYRNNIGLRKVSRSSFLLGEAFTPIGAILPYAGVFAPLGYLFCDGSLVSRQEYPALYQAIGSVYGSGTNPIYFRLPDMRGRFGLGNTSMRNSLSNISVIKEVIGAISGTTVTLSSTDGITQGASVTGAGITTTTVVVTSVGTSSVILSEAVTLADAANLTFTFKVLSDSVTAGDVTRVTNEGSNLAPSTLGSSNGRSHVSLDTTGGTNAATFPTGSAQSFGTAFDINVANPYLTINYIIRAGVGTTSI